MSKIIKQENEIITINPIIYNPQSLEELLLDPASKNEVTLIEVINPLSQYHVTYRKSPIINTFHVASGISLNPKLENLFDLLESIEEKYSLIYFKTLEKLKKYPKINLNKIEQASFIYIYNGDEFRPPKVNEITTARELLESEIAKAYLLTDTFYKNMNLIGLDRIVKGIKDLPEDYTKRILLNDENYYQLFFDKKATKRVSDTFKQSSFLVNTAKELETGKYVKGVN